MPVLKRIIIALTLLALSACCSPAAKPPQVEYAP